MIKSVDYWTSPFISTFHKLQSRNDVKNYFQLMNWQIPEQTWTVFLSKVPMKSVEKLSTFFFTNSYFVVNSSLFSCSILINIKYSNFWNGIPSACGDMDKNPPVSFTQWSTSQRAVRQQIFQANVLRHRSHKVCSHWPLGFRNVFRN